MLKRTILIIAIAAMAVPAFGALGKFEGGKIESGLWPAKYIPQRVNHPIEVYLNVGYYVEIKDVQLRKIHLDQINWETYRGSTKFKIRSNFEALVGADIVKTEDAVIGNYSAWVGDDSGDGEDEIIAPTTTWNNELEVTAQIKKAQILKAEGGPDCKLHVADVYITVVPTAAPNFYCP